MGGPRDPIAQHRRQMAVSDAAERRRIDAVRDAGARPRGCSEQIVDVAPGRGPTMQARPVEMQATDAGNWRVRDMTLPGQRALRRITAFDRMEDQRQRRQRGRGAPLFTPTQRAVGEAYDALHERLEGAGVRCSSLEALSQSGGGGGSFIEALIRDRRRFDHMRAAVGDEIVLVPRNSSAHRYRARVAIAAIDVIECVCIRDLTVSGILQRYGWSRKADVIEKIMRALLNGLDQIQGATSAGSQHLA